MLKNGQTVILDGLKCQVVEIVATDDGDNTFGLLNTQTFAIIYQYANTTEMLEQLKMVYNKVQVIEM